MADIFISYAREDQARIRGLVSALEEQGWSVFWDRRIPAGKTWQSYIGRALSDAKCVIVAWSQHSITSDWVIEEANDGKKRGLLIPVLLDPVEPPLGFRGIQAADLNDWKPGSSSLSFDQLIQDIAGVAGGKPIRPTPEEELPGKTQPAVPPGAVQTELPPHEPALTKPQTPKVRSLLIGAMIISGIAIVAGLTLWVSREPKRLAGPSDAQNMDTKPKERAVTYKRIGIKDYQNFLKNWDEKKHAVLYALIQTPAQYDALFSPAPVMGAKRPFAPEAELYTKEQILVVGRVMVAPKNLDQAFEIERVTERDEELALHYRFNEPKTAATYSVKNYLAIRIPRHDYKKVIFFENGNRLGN
jgi:hypothetical protein